MSMVLWIAASEFAWLTRVTYTSCVNEKWMVGIKMKMRSLINEYFIRKLLSSKLIYRPHKYHTDFDNILEEKMLLWRGNLRDRRITLSHDILEGMNMKNKYPIVSALLRIPEYTFPENRHLWAVPPLAGFYRERTLTTLGLLLDMPSFFFFLPYLKPNILTCSLMKISLNDVPDSTYLPIIHKPFIIPVLKCTIACCVIIYCEYISSWLHSVNELASCYLSKASNFNNSNFKTVFPHQNISKWNILSWSTL